MPTYTDLVARLRGATTHLGEAERTDVRRVIELVEAHVASPPEANAPSTVPLRIELRGLSERLGRRSSEGIPAASLARALAADLSGYAQDAEAIREECDGQLGSMGH